MKVYVTSNGITLVGKAWEIKAKLKEYAKTYDTIAEMRNAEPTPQVVVTPNIPQWQQRKKKQGHRHSPVPLS